MVKVKNKTIINTLAKSSFKYNKTRNIISIIAVILTAVLFTTIFTLSFTFAKTFEQQMIRQVGTSCQGGFKYLTLEQYEKLSKHKDIKDISYSVPLGTGENKEFRKNYIEIRGTKDEAAAKNTFNFPTSGTMPKNENELATNTKVLDLLGIPKEIGQDITLEYSIDGEKIKETFKLSGFWESDDLAPANIVWLNLDYVNKKLKEFNLPYYNSKIATGKIDANFHLNSSFNIEKKILKIINESGYNPSEIEYGVNWAYVGNKGFDFFGVLAISVSILLIIFSGYLIISNIFYISIFRDIKIYGLLKTIGTTNKQIRYLIKKQANYICVISIPLGLIFGYFIGKFIAPTFISFTTATNIIVSINPFIFVFSTVFTLITINISILKPCKFISKLTAIETIRYTENTKQIKRKYRKTKKINIFNIAYQNVMRNKKKFILVTISLSLSSIILNIAFSMANSLDLDKYLKTFIYGDFVVADLSYFNRNKLFNPKENNLNSYVINEISNIKGIEKIKKVYFNSIYVEKDIEVLSALREKLDKDKEDDIKLLDKKINDINEPLIAHIYGVDDSIFKDFEVLEGKIDLEKLKTGKYIIVKKFRDDETNIYNVGDNIYFENEKGEKKEYEVLAIAENPYSIDVKYSTGIGLVYYLPNDIFLENFESIEPMFLSLNISKINEKDVEENLKNYTKNVNEDIEYTSKSLFIEEFKNEKKSFQMIGILISSILGLIGILNFINTIVTSIIARKGEISILQSIGMTEKQIKKLLIFEGNFYLIISFFIAITIGSLIGFGVIKFTIQNSPIMSLNYTTFPSLILVLLMICISIITISICEKRLKSASIVERLREFDN